ncbi:site-specific integrase [Gracilimonas sp. BCB1]|uniref:site-specific integrase n=1 Tax=Gracilimonas sp. BCB1 TaxID=3152362 RepID=UPI0032D9A612
MATIKPILYTYRQNKDGSYPIYISIADSKKTLYHSTRINIHKSKWSEKREKVLGDGKEAQKINKIIADKLAECESISLELRLKGVSPSATRIKDILTDDSAQGSNKDFIQYGLDYAEELSKKKKIGTSKRYKSVFIKLSEFQKGKLYFDDITTVYLRKYETYLATELGNSATTITSNLKTMRSIYRKAIDEDIIAPKKDPFEKLSFKKDTPSRERLTVEEIESIVELEYGDKELINKVRDAFLFSFYCAGIRFSDVCQLKWDDWSGEYISYRMSKTDKPKKVYLIDQAVAILEKWEGISKTEYIFDLLNPKKDLSDARKLYNQISSKNALANKYLKKIAKDAEIEKKISFHVARHSFADIARVKGWDLYNISKALGHATLNITEKYLNEFDQDALDNEMKDNFL